MTMRVRNLYSNTLIAAFLCLGILLVPLHSMHFDLSMIPGDLLDNRHNNYMIENAYKWITGHVENFWDTPMCYPVPNVTAYSDHYLGTVLIYSVFRLLDFDRETSFQFWAIVLFALNYLSAAYVLRKMGIHVLGVVCGSFVFAFSMPVMAQMPRIQLLARFMVPLIFLFTMEYLDRPGLKILLKLCLSIVVQFYCTFYIGYLSVLGVMTFVIAYSLLNFKKRNELPFFTDFTRDLWKKIAVVSGSALLLLPVMANYIKVAGEYGFRKWVEIALMLPRISSYLFPPDGTLLWNWLKPVGRGLPMPWEHYLFPGAFPIVAVIALAVIYRSSSDRDDLLEKGFIAVVSLVILIVMTISVYGVSPYRLIYKLIPGLSSLRSVGRIIFIDLFLLSMISGIVITRCWALLSGKHPVLKTACAMFLMGVVVADQFVVHPESYSKKEAQERSRRVETLVMKRNPGGRVFAYMPLVKKASLRTVVLDNVDAMMAAQKLDKRTVNGYTGQYTREFQIMRDSVLFASETRCLALRRWGKVTEKLYNRPNWYANITIIDPDEPNPCPDSIYADTNISGIDHPLEDKACLAEISFTRPFHIVTQTHHTRDPFDFNIFPLNVIVKNISTVTWPAMGDIKGKYVLGLSFRWLKSDKNPITGYVDKYFFMHDMAPHESQLFNIPLICPFGPGEYFLEFDVFQDSASWFSEKGSKTSMVRIIVK